MGITSDQEHTSSENVIEEPIETGELVEVVGHDSIQWRAVIIVTLSLFIIAFGAFAFTVALTQQIERLTCKSYVEAAHFNGTTDPCKSVEVQKEVAYVLGINNMMDAIPGLLVAIPYGALADTRGRRFVLVLGYFGLALDLLWQVVVCWFELPIRLVWLGPMFTLIGGGGTVVSATLFVIASDATPEAYRSRVFFYISSAFLLSELLGPSMAGILIENNVWAALLIGPIGATVALLVGLLIPETYKHVPKTLQGDTDETAPLIHGEQAPGDEEALEEPSAPIEPWYAHATKTIGLVFKDRKITIIALCFMATYFARSSLGLLLQYVHVSFDWSLSKASYFTSFRAFAQLIANCLVLPAIDYILLKKLHMPSKVKDLRMAKISMLIFSVAFFILAIAPNIWVVTMAIVLYTFGSGFVSFARSLISSLVSPDMVGTLYTAISVADSLGMMIAGPLVAGAYGKGLQLGEQWGPQWRGLPWLTSFAFCAVATIAMAKIQIAVDHSDQDDDNADA